MAEAENKMLQVYSLMSNGKNPCAALDSATDDAMCVSQMRYLLQGKTPAQLRDMATLICAVHGMSAEDMARQMDITIPSDR